MAPKNKFTKEEMTAAALRVVRAKGIAGPDRKDDGGRVGYIYAADLHGLWLHGQRQAGGLCRCNARV